MSNTGTIAVKNHMARKCTRPTTGKVGADHGGDRIRFLGRRWKKCASLNIPDIQPVHQLHVVLKIKSAQGDRFYRRDLLDDQSSPNVQLVRHPVWVLTLYAAWWVAATAFLKSSLSSDRRFRNRFSNDKPPPCSR